MPSDDDGGDFTDRELANSVRDIAAIENTFSDLWRRMDNDQLDAAHALAPVVGGLIARLRARIDAIAKRRDT